MATCDSHNWDSPVIPGRAPGGSAEAFAARKNKGTFKKKNNPPKRDHRISRELEREQRAATEGGLTAGELFNEV